MKTLFIFDNDSNFITNVYNSIDLFPLTSNFILLEKIEKKFKTKSLNTAKLIHEEVKKLQQSIHEWSYQFGNFHVKNKTLKEWFLLPDQSGSAWWFGLISEKNSVQDNVFFKIAQINAIYHFLNKNDYVECIISLTDKMQAKIIKKIIKSKIKKVIVITVKKPKAIKEFVFDFMKQAGIFGALFSSLLHWFIWIRDGYKARKVLGPINKRLKNVNPFLFVTYFPNIDDNAAKKGIFINKYALAIQEKLAELQVPITWLAMPVYYNGHNYDSSLNLAKNFSKNGENLFLLQEFFTFKIFIKGFFWWLRQFFISIFLYYHLNIPKTSQKIIASQCFSYIRYLWWHSFVGTSGTRGIIFYLVFNEMFRQIPNVNNCLYYCEMQAWEKALLLAKNKITPKTISHAFQHTIVTKNFFHYFYDPRETEQKNLLTDFPIANHLIANGNLTYSLLLESQYPNLRQAEAIRQLYIKKMMRRPSQKNILFVGGSYDKTEMKSLLSMLHLIKPKLGHYTIWLKGSPINPLEPIFNELNISWQKEGYHILFKDVKEILPEVSIALIANTTVALEALAFDCPLIIPIFSDTMLMNPVIDTAAQFTMVSTPDELLNALIERTPMTGNSEIITHYWNLDNAIPQWSELLSMPLV